MVLKKHRYCNDIDVGYSCVQREYHGNKWPENQQRWDYSLEMWTKPGKLSKLKIQTRRIWRRKNVKMNIFKCKAFRKWIKYSNQLFKNLQASWCQADIEYLISFPHIHNYFMESIQYFFVDFNYSCSGLYSLILYDSW